MHSVSDSNSGSVSSIAVTSVNTSVSTERPPLASLLKQTHGHSSSSGASPMASVGTTHSIGTMNSSSRSGIVSTATLHEVPPPVNDMRSVASGARSTGSSSQAVGVLRHPGVAPSVASGGRSWAPKLKKGDKLCWTKGRLLGRGAHGSVFLGLESTSGTLVAVKEMEFDPDDAALSERLASLQTELRLLKKLEHPNIVGYYSAARQATSFLVFMEYVAGGSLASILEQFGRLQESLVMSFATQILTGLQYLHDNQVVHSDIKCANVLISVEGTAKLADFGSARIMEGDTQAMNGEGGTAFWMAPEVIRQEQVTYQSDIWSFGCTVLEMLTNEIPFNFLGNAFCVMSFVARGEEAIEMPAYIKQTLSANALDLIMICLKRDPRQRATLQELQDHAFFAPIRPPKQAFQNKEPTPILSPNTVPTPLQYPSVSSNATSVATSVVSASRPGSQASSLVSTGVYIPQSILAAAGVAPSASIASAADSSRTDVSEVAVRDHLVRKALVSAGCVVPGEGQASALPLRDNSVSMENSNNSQMAGNKWLESVSSVDTISLSEVSARQHSEVGASNGIITTHDVVNLMSSAMQDYVAHSMTESADRDSIHPLSSRHGASSNAPAVITFVLDEEDDAPSGIDSAEITLTRLPSRERHGTDMGCCGGDDVVGDEEEEEDGEGGLGPPRKANRLQAVLLAVTSILVIVAVILVIIYSNGM